MEKATKRYRAEPGVTPVFDSLASFAQGSERNLARYEKLVQAYEDHYGEPPKFLARAPGRVNLIGEHVDYCGYGVLPMAVEQDIAMAFTPNDSGTITLANTNPIYPPHEADTANYTINTNDWYNYFLCGFKGVVEELKIETSCGFKVLVDGTVPPSAGLSSSSALVCCAALITVLANDIDLPTKKDLAELCARSERFIGTQGGGMDQAISFLAEPGKALRIDFNPLRCSDVTLPQGYVFVVGNTKVNANKTAFAGYNQRVVECRLAAKLIAKAQGKDWRSVRKLGDVQEALSLELQEMPAVVSDCLHEAFYSKEEICQALEIAVDSLEAETLSDMSDLAKAAARDLEVFKLFQRASHVYQEAQRVALFQEAANSGIMDPSGVARRLGELMSASHASCRDLYECSGPELDALVSCCTDADALGSRLTGAGWGGCNVSLVAKGNLEGFMEHVGQNHYKLDQMEEIRQCLFPTEPGPGAAVCEL